MDIPVHLDAAEAHALAVAALRGAGADEDSARSLADATVSAHLNGRPEVGFGHLLDYLAAYRAGRINPAPSPSFTRLFPAFLAADADGGIAQLGFDRAFAAMVETARQNGIALFAQNNSFTTGELGHYVRRIAAEGLAALAFTNANAFMAPAPGLPRLYSTNPMAFAFPLGEGRPPVLIDQSSSATAFVNLANAAARGEPLAEGMAVDSKGKPTVDPSEAMQGALLPFGGRKGANVALMVELMAAGLAGGAWSVDMPDFQAGSERLNAALTIILFQPGAAGGETGMRSAAFADRLKSSGTYVPGLGPRATGAAIILSADLNAAISAYIRRA